MISIVTVWQCIYLLFWEGLNFWQLVEHFVQFFQWFFLSFSFIFFFFFDELFLAHLCNEFIVRSALVACFGPVDRLKFRPEITKSHHGNLNGCY